MRCVVKFHNFANHSLDTSYNFSLVNIEVIRSCNNKHLVEVLKPLEIIKNSKNSNLLNETRSFSLSIFKKNSYNTTDQICFYFHQKSFTFFFYTIYLLLKDFKLYGSEH